MKQLVTALLIISVALHLPTLHAEFMRRKAKSVPMIDVGYMRASSFSIVTPKGKNVLMTAAHVCRDFLPGMYKVNISEKADLCIIDTNKKLPALKLARSYRNFEPAWVLGYPFGQTLTMTQGNFAGKMPGINDVEEPVITAQVYPGNSGGPVLNLYGHVVGVISATMPYTNRTLIVSLEEIKEFLRDK